MSSTRLVHLVVTTAVLVALGCTTWVRARPDGGTEYQLEDGGWVGAGDGCGCENLQHQVTEPGYGNVLLECMPNPELQCDPWTGMRPNGSACGGGSATVCFGVRCCVWVCPQRGCR